MKSSHKTDTYFYFIIQQLTINKPFKCDCTCPKKKHGFSTFQKWQIWPNFTIVKTQLHWYTEFQYETRTVLKHILCCCLCENVSGGIPNAHRRETKTWRVFWHQESACNKQVSTLGILILRKPKLLRHLNPSQSCNGFRLYFGVSVRFNMIPFNWFLR